MNGRIPRVSSTAPERLVTLANDYIAPMCKYFGMFAQIGQGIDTITPDTITFHVHVGRPFNRKHNLETEKEQRDVVYNIRNMYLFGFGDLLPCPRFEAVYSDDVLNIHEKEFSGLFYDSCILSPGRPTAALPVLGKPIRRVRCGVLPEREHRRKEFESEWRKLVGEIG